VYVCAQFDISSYKLSLITSTQNVKYTCHHKGSVFALFSGKNKITNEAHGA